MAKKTKQAKSEKGAEPSLRWGIGCLILFALPFALVGAGMAWVVVDDLWTWHSAQQWVETPATLLSSELDTDAGDDGDTYEVIAKYAYDFAGTRYENDRVALHGGRDNVGSYHQDRAAELDAALKAGGRTVCYVNPRDPTEAMLFRDLRPGMVSFKLMFALVFGGVGFGLLGVGTLGYRRAKREEALKKSAPGKPWLWRDDWAAGRIRSSDGMKAWFITFFAAFWNGMTWPICFMMWTGEKGKGGPPLLLLALFPAAGALVAAWAGYLWLRRIRWGVSEFELAAVPGVIGGPLAGVVRAPRRIKPLEGFVLRLACNKAGESSSNSGSSSAMTLWETEQTIRRDLTTADGSGTMIPVKFLVPYAQLPSSENVKWLLEVRAETLGVDYLASFEVPMFRTAASSPEVNIADAEKAEGDETTEPATFAMTVARMNAVLEEDLPDRRTIRFPIARNRGLAGFLALLGAVWTALTVGLFVSGAPRLFPWVFALFDVFIVYAMITTCFSSTLLEYSARGVVYSHRLFGVGRRREVLRSDVTAIGVDKSGTTYGETAYRKVMLTSREGSRMLVSEIPRLIDAERLAADMRRVLELETNATAMPLDANLPSDFLEGQEN